MTIKQHGGVFGRNPSFNDVSVETLSIAGTALSSTAAELNILDGVTADATELNYLDGASTSVVTASKAVLANSSANIAFASGNGIDFSADANAAGMTSELLDDYEEGTWTPGANGITYAAGTTGKYTKVANLVTCTFTVVFPATADASNAQIQALPFISACNTAAIFGNYSSGFNGPLNSGNAFIGLVNTTGTAFITNATLSGQTLVGSVSYQV